MKRLNSKTSLSEGIFKRLYSVVLAVTVGFSASVQRNLTWVAEELEMFSTTVSTEDLLLTPTTHLLFPNKPANWKIKSGEDRWRQRQKRTETEREKETRERRKWKDAAMLAESIFYYLIKVTFICVRNRVCGCVVEWEERCFTSRFLSIKFAPCWQCWDKLLELSIQTMSISVSAGCTGEEWEIKQQGAEEGRTTGYNLLVHP